MFNLIRMTTRESRGANPTRMVIALLLVVCANAGAGCSSGTSDPAGAGGTGNRGIGRVRRRRWNRRRGGIRRRGEPERLRGTVNGSCRRNNGVDCAEYTDLSASTLDTIVLACGNNNIGTWTAGSACDRGGALGGCREMLGTACQVYWTYTGSAADAMSECAGDMGSWVSP